jgi:ATP-dependent Clp endopeptidase proteolytic subunit ClpP
VKFWNLKKTGKSAEMTLYGPISESSWWGDEVTPKQFADDLAAVGEVDEIKVRINSGGGDVFAGVAIHNMLKRHSASVTVFVDGIAASIASIIAMAGDKIVMPKGSMMMIHNPWTYTYGDANELRKMAETLDQIRDSLVSIYEDKTGMKAEEIVALLDATTWFSASEAVENGFATEVEQSVIAASIRDGQAVINGIKIDWSKFMNAPQLPVYDAPEPEGQEIEPLKAKYAAMKRNLEIIQMEV